jgi:hypothetical protein
VTSFIFFSWYFRRRLASNTLSLTPAAARAKPFSAYQECPARGVSVATEAGHSEIHYFAFDAMTDIARASRLATIFAAAAANFLK